MQLQPLLGHCFERFDKLRTARLALDTRIDAVGEKLPYIISLLPRALEANVGISALSCGFAARIRVSLSMAT